MNDFALSVDQLVQSIVLYPNNLYNYFFHMEGSTHSLATGYELLV